MSERETIIEVRVSGAFAQVSAIDVATGLEVSVTTPVSASRADQHALALRKLKKALDNENSQNSMTNLKSSGTPPSVPTSSKRGFLA
jgi:hypothetical protein